MSVFDPRKKKLWKIISQRGKYPTLRYLICRPFGKNGMTLKRGGKTSKHERQERHGGQSLSKECLENKYQPWHARKSLRCDLSQE